MEKAGSKLGIVCLDTETTGLDLHHGSKPYFVTTCNLDGVQKFWSWTVDPTSRMVESHQGDVEEIWEEVVSAEAIIAHNGKFDVKALATLGDEFGRWPWYKTHDTLIAGHLLASNMPHDLTSLVLMYLGKDIQPLEDALEDAVKECRRKVQQARLRIKRGKVGARRTKNKKKNRESSLFDSGEADREDAIAEWRIAEKGLPEMPSAKEETWKFDTWLPWEYASYFDLPEEHHYWTVLRDYANADSAYTLALWQVMMEELFRQDLWEIYLEMRKLPEIIYDMEHRGVALSKSRLNELRETYKEESHHKGQVCLVIAESLGYDLKLPKTGNNKSLMEFCFDSKYLGLPTFKKTESGKPSLDKEAMGHYAQTLPSKSKQLAFVSSLKHKRKRDTGITYLDGYERFWLPHRMDRALAAGEPPECRVCGHVCIGDVCNGCGAEQDSDWYILHPSLNQTGTDTLRMSSSNPNAQNFSKQEVGDGEDAHSLRYCLGPAPGREWWKFDAQNIELRIPAFESEEKDLIEIFLHPERAPYFGSYHLAIFDVLHPQLFAKHGAACKDLFDSTWYQWVKNGNFAVIYGCQERKADQTYHVPGAFQKVRHRFPKMAALSDWMVDLANRQGYVETIPDKTVNPRRGYPILCSRTEWGRVSPTVPLNYHVQSTAMWWMRKAMIRVYEKLKEWRKTGFDGFIALQVHDELDLDFPKSRLHPREEQEKNSKFPRHGSNLWRALEIKRLMELGGQDLGIPTPVSMKYHEHNWSEGVSI